MTGNIGGVSQISNIFDDAKMNEDFLNNVKELTKRSVCHLRKNHTTQFWSHIMDGHTDE